ncbi:MAG TPA: hypothetical protein PLL18_15330, partial [Flavobacteriales bacterium]|nr:hypothetical protein [Flavobacteriales bacterium]
VSDAGLIAEPFRKRLEEAGIGHEQGGHTLHRVLAADEVVKSPGIPDTASVVKALRSTAIRPAWMVGIDPQSEGLARARDSGVRTTAEGVDGLLPHIEADGIRIA